MELETQNVSEPTPASHIISLVCPVYNGAEYLADLVEQMSVVRSKLAASPVPVTIGEALFVIDEALDHSASVLQELKKEHSWIEVIELSKGYGQHPATAAGILHTAGDWIVTLDEDLQHHPRYIPSLLAEAISNRSDIIYAKPIDGPHKSFFRDFASTLIKLLISWITTNEHVSDFNSYRLVRGPIARAAASVMGHDGYYDVVLGWFTGRINVQKVEMTDVRSQTSASSGYTLKKLISHARRMMVSSQTKVMRTVGMLGLFALMISIALGFYILHGILIGNALEVRGWSSLAFLSLFFGSLTCLLFFVLFEYLSILTLHNQGKPTFHIIDRTRDTDLVPYIKDLYRL